MSEVDGYSLIFDTETSGLVNYKQPYYHESQPHLVQLGAVMLNRQLVEIGSINAIIRPEGWVIPPSTMGPAGFTDVDEARAAGIKPAACDIHGISHERAMDEGIPLEMALEVFGAMAEQVDFTICHNADFDVGVLMTESHRAGMMAFLPPRNLCTMKSTTDLIKLPGKYNSFKWPKLQELHYYLFGTYFDSAHDAMVDVRATQRCFQELVKRGHEDWYYSRIVYGA